MHQNRLLECFKRLFKLTLSLGGRIQACARKKRPGFSPDRLISSMPLIIRGNLSGISSSDYLEARADVIVIVVIANSNSNDTADNSEAKQRTAEQSAATAESATESAAATE